MIYILLNVWPIAAATLLGLVIGYVWMRAAGMLLPGWAALAGTALAEFWLAAILAGALILAPAQADQWVMAIGSAVVIWIGFVVPVLAVTFMAHAIAWRQTVLAALYWLAVMVGQAALMQGIGLVPPPAA
ncbi:hypothetical protein C0V72_04200 [Porphyrobacter sp. TH134]|uniref:hypothetical protein n=1 Tax=Porphyrobacter sp. TH134 TaxID=2067450 RepID=UPI000C7CF639|nr:hypothetical protein [Porphyrobacter sp. TH134]PLK24944.1 hypothetical protein C0V72_04200 [Porphyrobacter sp. TH134]